MKHSTNFIAIDLGASNGRVLLGRWDGSRFDLHELHRFANGPVNVLGSLHWDVLQLWSEIKTGLARYAQQWNEPLAGIGLDTWGVDYALLDRAGRLLGNPYHYRDARTDGMVERAFELAGRDAIFNTTGIQFMQLNTLYQVLSMVERRDPQLAAAETLLMLPDLFHYWLTGRRVAEYTIASTSQMLDARSRTWANALLASLGIPAAILPPVTMSGTVLGELRPEVAAETGLRHAPPVIAVGSHDTASAVAAVPGLDGRSAYISSGTWSLVGVETPQPVIDQRALALNFTNEGGASGNIRLLKNVTGLWLLQESRRQWQREGRDYGWGDLLALAGQALPFRSLIDPDARDFAGPGDMPAAIRAYCRRTGQPEPGDVGAVVRCCLESLALKARWVIEALESLLGHSLETIRIVGGGSQNHLLAQWTADACQRPVVAGPVEATALGNLMVQAIAAGHLPNVAAGRQAVAASVELHAFEPGPAGSWQEAWGRFQELLAAQA
ncbi:MAG TPA: rhamnulokinase family protein [Anaerolineae bacterium]|nr:rhamnulokinase family protein [Anaerolineae bacterium]